MVLCLFLFHDSVKIGKLNTLSPIVDGIDLPINPFIGFFEDFVVTFGVSEAEDQKTDLSLEV